MRKLLTWLAGLAGVAALLRRRSRRHAPALPSRTDAPDPAVELRHKLQETRAAEPAQGTDVEESSSLDERRARVHERAQDAINLMRTTDAEPPPNGDAA